MQKDGQPLRAHLEQVEKDTKRRPIELDGPELPNTTAYLWDWYLLLSSGRQPTGFGLGPLTYSEIDAFARLMGVTFKSWEVLAMKMLDATYLSIQTSKESSGG